MHLIFTGHAAPQRLIIKMTWDGSLCRVQNLNLRTNTNKSVFAFCSALTLTC